MILAVDVGYFGQGARAAGVLFQSWESESIDSKIVVDLPLVEAYIPGEFFRRELSPVEKVVAGVCAPLDCIVIDGYVTLGDPPAPGLGMHLWERLGRTTPVIGVAKSAFHGTLDATKLYRGRSSRPLFITSVGMPLDDAKHHIMSMKGQFRMPDFLKEVDRISRKR